MSWRRLLVLDLALLGCMILASRAGLIIHEVGGHAVPAMLFGAKKVTFKLSYFGGGSAMPDRYPMHGVRHFVFCLGGIGLNLLTGAACWIVAIRFLKKKGLLHAFLLMLGAGSFGQAIFYLGNGFYWGTGDPVGFDDNENIASLQWMWVFFVPAMAAAAWFGARSWIEFLSAHAPVDTTKRRLGMSAATVGAITVAYFGLWAATWEQGIDIKLSDKWQEEQIALEMRKLPPPPPPSSVPSQSPAVRVPPPPRPVPPEVIARVKEQTPLPIASIALLGAALLGAGLSLRRTPSVSDPVALPTWTIAAPVVLAGISILAIRLLGR